MTRSTIAKVEPYKSGIKFGTQEGANTSRTGCSTDLSRTESHSDGSQSISNGISDFWSMRPSNRIINRME